MKKILTVSIAAYNVEKFIKKTLDSILVDNIDDLEVLVEDDGGKDSTADIVKEYERKYPGIVKLIHKENGGYGSTINKSLEIATGKYFKQLDGDDWYDSENFEKLLELLRTNDVDCVYTPFIKWKEGTEEKELVDYYDSDIEGIHDLEDIIGKSKESMIMHSLLYKTQLLRDCKLQLLEKCFYTDTQYAMFPMVSVKTIYITHMPIYMYRIGREEQSISIGSHRKHYDNYRRVSEVIMEFYNKNVDKMGKNEKEYFFNYVKWHMGNTITGFYMVLEQNKDNLEKIKKFDKYVLENNKELYDAMAVQSKIVKLLRKTNYNYFVYKTLSKMKISKIESKQK